MANVENEHQSQDVEYPTNYIETLMHLIKGNVGTGIFAMGDAFKNSGLILGSCLTIFLGIITAHISHLLLQAADKMIEEANADKNISYAQTAGLCFANGPEKCQKRATTMRMLTDILLCFTQFGCCCVYIVFIAANLKNMLDVNGIHLAIHVHMLIVYIPLLLTSLVRNLKYLSPLSALANLLMLIVILICIYYCVRDIPPIASRKYFANVKKLPLFFGTTVYAFLSIGLILPLRNEMKNPRLFTSTFGVLNIGMAIVTAAMTCLGFLAYLKYGEDILGSVTLNLDQTDIVAQIVKILTSLALLLTFPLQFYVVISIIHPMVVYKCGPFYHTVLAELVVRTALVTIAFLMACVIPFLELFISLVGSLTGVIILFVIPPVLEFATHMGKPEMTAWIVLKNTFILALAIVVCISGTYLSFAEIVKAFQEHRIAE